MKVLNRFKRAWEAFKIDENQIMNIYNNTINYPNIVYQVKDPIVLQSECQIRKGLSSTDAKERLSKELVQKAKEFIEWEIFEEGYTVTINGKLILTK